MKCALALVASLLLLAPSISCSKKRSGKAAPASEMYQHHCFSIQSPGEEWSLSEEISKFILFAYAYKITFSLQPSATHSKIACVQERKRFGSYDSPDEFRKSAAGRFIEIYQSPRYEMIQQEFYSDKECGDYCLVHFFTFKDRHAPNRGGAEYLLSKGKEYYFILPENDSYFIHASYSERGMPGELKNVVGNADKFFKGMALLRCK